MNRKVDCQSHGRRLAWKSGLVAAAIGIAVVGSLAEGISRMRSVSASNVMTNKSVDADDAVISVVSAKMPVTDSITSQLGIDTHNQPNVDVEQILHTHGLKAFRWFQDHRDPKTGLVLDFSPNPADGMYASPKSRQASIASLGYFLATLSYGVENGLIARDEAENQAIQALKSMRSVDNHEGVWYHFIDVSNGKRWANCEVSILDTAIALHGAMVSSVFFGGEVTAITDELLDRVNWDHFVIDDPKTGLKFLSLGWTPEQGLLGPCNVRTSEMLMPYLLAIGSRTHAIPPEYWYNTLIAYQDVVTGEGTKSPVLHGNLPLFVHFYGLGWLPPGWTDRDNIDLHQVATDAARANRSFCHWLAEKVPTYRDGWWGISAGDAPMPGKPNEYIYIAPGPMENETEGTVWPAVAEACIVWIDNEVKEDIARWSQTTTWKQIDKKYGLAPFNQKVAPTWVAPQIIGIDLGSFLVNLSNYQAKEKVWDLWAQHPIAQNALHRLEFTRR